MQFIYIGTEDAADPDGTEAFGQWFPISEPVTVTDPRVIAKLSGHPHFEAADGDGADEAEAPDSEAPVAKRRGRPRKVA